MIIELSRPAKDLPNKAVELFCKKHALIYLQGVLITSRLLNLNKYINKKFNINCSLKDLITECITESIITVENNNVKVIIPDTLLPTYKVSADTIARLITYGSLEIRGTSIILDIWQYVNSML